MILASNLVKFDVNSKIPAPSHYISLRAQSLNLNANGTTVLSLSNNYASAGQRQPVTGNPANSAPTATPYDVNSEPQLGAAVFIPSTLIIRNPNGSLVVPSVAGHTVNVSVYNQNVSAVNATTGVVTRTPGTLQTVAAGVNVLASANFASSASGAFPWTAESVYQFDSKVSPVTGAAQTPPTSAPQGYGADASWTPVLFRPVLGDTLAVAVTVAGYTTGTASATGFTLDLIGTWINAL